MDFLYYILGGIVHGIAEFLAIDSSAHVASLTMVGGGYNQTVCIALSIGSILAAMEFCRSYVWRLTLGFKDVLVVNKTQNRDLFITLALATLPAIVVFGIAERCYYVHVGRIWPLWIFGLSTIFSAVILLLCDRTQIRDGVSEISRKHSLIAGLIQMASVIPGMNGMCLSWSVLRYYGYSRQKSFRYSLLLYIPITIGIVIFKCTGYTIHDFRDCTIGAVSSFLVAFASLHAITYLLNRDKYTFVPVAIYKMFFGTCIVIFYITLFSRP